MSRYLVLALVLLAGASASKLSTRVIGGEATTIEEYPSMVSVESWTASIASWNHVCAGTILNNRYILSAAHCFYGPDFVESNGRVRLGSTTSNVGGTVIPIERVINHPNWSSFLMTDDISIVYLSSSIVYSDSIQQGTIVSQGSVVPDNVPVTYVGWGSSEISGGVSEVLQHVTVNTIPYAICKERYGDLINENVICGGVLDVGGQDICENDSGGPMYYNGLIVGVISFGFCGNPTLPSVSSNVASYTNWILATAV